VLILQCTTEAPRHNVEGVDMADGPEPGGWQASGRCGDAAAHAYIDPIQSLRPVRTLSAGQNIRS
jgi:hypothetical protein